MLKICPFVETLYFVLHGKLVENTFSNDFDVKMDKLDFDMVSDSCGDTIFQRFLVLTVQLLDPRSDTRTVNALNTCEPIRLRVRVRVEHLGTFGKHGVKRHMLFDEH